MPVEVRWYLDKRVMESRYWGQITLEDIKQGVGEGLELIKGYPYPIPHIIELSASTSVETSLGNYSDLAAQLRQLDKRNWVIIVGVTGVTKFIASVVTHMAGLSCKLTDSLDEAHTFAEHVAAPEVQAQVDN